MVSSVHAVVITYAAIVSLVATPTLYTGLDIKLTTPETNLCFTIFVGYIMSDTIGSLYYNKAWCVRGWVSGWMGAAAQGGRWWGEGGRRLLRCCGAVVLWDGVVCVWGGAAEEPWPSRGNIVTRVLVCVLVCVLVGNGTGCRTAGMAVSGSTYGFTMSTATRHHRLRHTDLLCCHALCGTTINCQLTSFLSSLPTHRHSLCTLFLPTLPSIPLPSLLPPFTTFTHTHLHTHTHHHLQGRLESQPHSPRRGAPVLVAAPHGGVRPLPGSHRYHLRDHDTVRELPVVL